MIDSRPTKDSHSSVVAALLRLFWMLLGYAVIVLLSLIIVVDSEGGFSWRDIAVGAVGLAIIAARYVDIARYRGDTAEGTPATMEHFRRYATRVAVGTPAVWGVAHLLAGLD